MQIEQKQLKALVPYINNSRTHNSKQIKQIASSIKEFGFTNPILLDDNGGIIAGHGRAEAAALLGMNEVPTITLSGLSKAQIKAYIIADNSLATNAGWDFDLLLAEIEGLQDVGFDISKLGFDDDFIAELFGENDDLVESYKDGNFGSMVEVFGAPPFSILDTRLKYWQERRTKWLAITGNLSVDLMKAIGQEFMLCLGELAEGVEFEIATGSGETVLCLAMAYPKTKFVAVYDNASPATTYSPNSPLCKLLPLLKNVRAQYGKA